ncbi:MAG: hypothetical protein ACJ75B_08325 [Flavisolibacter sp.]
MILTKADIQQAPFDSPAIIGYNRLEGIPISPNYRKSLSAEVRDAMWMLSRQWQMGEFDGMDSGSAIKSKVLTEQQQMTHFGIGNDIFPLGQSFAKPLEMEIEQENIIPDLAFRIESGKLFRQIINDNNLELHLEFFLKKFKIQLLENAQPNTPEETLLSLIRQNNNDSEVFDSLKDRTLDGYEIYKLLDEDYEQWVNNTFSVVGTVEADSAINAGSDFKKQFVIFYGASLVKSNSAWLSNRLDYRFSIQNQEDPSKATILDAGAYSGDRLDWYDFNVRQKGAADITTRSNEFIPSAVTYPGMPKPRWWEMEENNINFGNINAKTTDLPTLMLIDFALLYSNDWLLIPFPMELNNICVIKGILVTDVFGYHTLIPALQRGSVTNWNKFSLFTHVAPQSVTDHALFYLAPTLLKPIQQDPLERVSFKRDEVSNLVWAFENIIPSSMGKGLRVYEIEQNQNKKETSISPEQEASLNYTLGKSVSFYQVPFIPVEILNQNHAQIRFQRATVPGTASPKSVLLTEVASPYYINEEEILNSGITVIRHWRRSRWIDGKVCQWVGREKQTGKSEGNNSLEFDVLSYNL